MNEFQARVAASGPRRVFALVVLAVLGGTLVYVGFVTPPQALGWQVFLIAAGLSALALSVRTWQATEEAVVLREDGLYETGGRQICRVDDIESVDRGLFAFKPSNGFLIRLKTPQPRAWAPGLWWRLGRRVGIGGVTPGAQARMMADLLTARIVERDRG